MSLFCIQLRKMFQRKDVWIAYILFFLIPIILAFLIRIESNIITIGDSVFSGIGFVGVVIGLLKGLFVFYILLFLFTTSLIAGEIDSLSDAVYYGKVEKRISIILSKINALGVMAITLMIDICISSSIGWFVFLRKSKFAYDFYILQSSDETQFIMMMIVLSVVEILVLLLFSANFSLILSQGKALMASFLLLIIFKLIENVELVQKFVPTYIGNLSNAMELTGEKFWNTVLLDGTVLLAYIVILIIILIKKYDRMDYVR